MTYEEIQSYYGQTIAQRLRREMTVIEIQAVTLEDLPQWLKRRTKILHQNYRAMLTNPTGDSYDFRRTGEACRAWRSAEDLAYLIALTKDADLKALVG